MRKQTKIILIAIIALFIVAMALYPIIKNNMLAKDEISDLQKGNSENRKKKILNINAQILKYEDLNDVLRTKGILLPDEEVDLSFETSGKIIKIYFKEGATVNEGDILAKVNDKALQAELKKLEAQIPLAQDRVFRQKVLLEKDAVSKEAYEQVATELEKLNADIELTKAKIAQTELRAPFSGIIGLRQVSEGTYASPSTVVAHLTKIMPLKIEFAVNEKQADNIKQGVNINFSIDNDINTYNASVYAVETELDLKTLSLKARALYPNSNGKLKPGRSAAIEIKLHEIKNTIVIPSQAIVAEMGKDIVYIYKNGYAKQVMVEKGLRTASSVQIVSGLSPGDTLITTGVMQLRDGIPTKIDTIN